MGPSASGKSILLQALSGRLQDMHISGNVSMNLKIVDCKATGNPIAYVPQGDSLQGELTTREVTLNTAILKRNEPADVLQHEVNTLMESLGLSHVCDGIIGTALFRGLSGGQKKRAEIACELIATPRILLLDEPTSGK
jgi:ABC-type multidrug transport system ATPase subunit